MKITRFEMFAGITFVLVVGSAATFIKSESFKSFKQFGTSVVEVDSLWQNYTYLKYQLFCETSDGTIMVNQSDRRELLRFKNAALAARDAELMVPMSNVDRIRDIEYHLDIFDRDSSHWVSSHSDHHTSITKGGCFSIRKHIAPKSNVIASQSNEKSKAIARG